LTRLFVTMDCGRDASFARLVLTGLLERCLIVIYISRYVDLDIGMDIGIDVY